MEGYIWTLEWFGLFQISFRVPGVTGTPRWVIGPTWASREKREGARRGPRAPPLPSPNRIRRRGRRPPSLYLSLSFLFPPIEKGKGGRILLGLGVQVGLPPWRAPPGRRPPPPLLYIRGWGAPQRHINCSLSRVRCPPPQFTPSVIAS